MNIIWIFIPYFLILLCVIIFAITIAPIQIDIKYFKEHFTYYEKLIKELDKNTFKRFETSENRVTQISTAANKRLNTLEENSFNLRKPLNDLALKSGYRFLFPISDGRQHEYCDCNKTKLVKVDEVKND